MRDAIDINDVAGAQRWVNIHHRMLCSDIQHINELYKRVVWLTLPWWRRLGRKPPWLGGAR